MAYSPSAFVARDRDVVARHGRSNPSTTRPEDDHCWQAKTLRDRVTATHNTRSFECVPSSVPSSLSRRSRRSSRSLIPRLRRLSPHRASPRPRRRRRQRRSRRRNRRRQRRAKRQRPRRKRRRPRPRRRQPNRSTDKGDRRGASTIAPAFRQTKRASHLSKTLSFPVETWGIEPQTSCSAALIALYDNCSPTGFSVEKSGERWRLDIHRLDNESSVSPH